MRAIMLLSWATAYEVHPNGVTLLPGACKRYLEDLLGAICHALERQRNASTGSTSSVPPLETSTPNRPRLTSVDEDDIRL
jgi:hypothetical protein